MKMEMKAEATVMDRVKLAAAKIREGRAELDGIAQQHGAKKVLDMILFGEVESLTVTSNVNRNPLDARGMHDGRPSLSWAIQLVIQEDGQGSALSTDAIFQGLEKRKWLPPGSKDPRPYVSRVLSGNPDVFVRDPMLGRGHYRLVPGFQVAPLFEEETTTEAPEVAKEEVFPKVLDVLQKTTEPFAIQDLAKATGISTRSIQGPIMTLLENGGIKRLRKASPIGRPLFSVNQKTLAAYVAQRGN